MWSILHIKQKELEDDHDIIHLSQNDALSQELESEWDEVRKILSIIMQHCGCWEEEGKLEGLWTDGDPRNHVILSGLFIE